VLWLRWGNTQSALQEYQLVATFLATLSLQDIRVALNWIQVPLTLFTTAQPFPAFGIHQNRPKIFYVEELDSENI
jgi:hypothetical protein